MKYIREIIIGIIFMSLLSLVACGTENTTGRPAVEEIADESSTKNQSEQSPSRIVDHELLGIEEYRYPSEFSMGDNLKTAITQLALSYNHFDKDSVSSGNWKEIFVARFIQNSRSSFDYLDTISEKNNGKISVDELNYIQYSLTGIELDFSSYADGFVDRYDDASALNYGFISGYDYEYTDNGVIVTADFEVGFDGMSRTQKSEITVELVKNPYSCFDGYSVVTVSSREVASSLEPDNSAHVFGGIDMMEENEGVFPFEFLYSEDDLGYEHFVYVDMTELPELADFVRKNAGKHFRVTFIWEEGNADAIGRVVPVDIILDE